MIVCLLEGDDWYERIRFEDVRQNPELIPEYPHHEVDHQSYQNRAELGQTRLPGISGCKETCRRPLFYRYQAKLEREESP